MKYPRLQPESPVVMAMVCAGAVTAQFIAGKAARDALYLANLDVTTLPAMVVATSIVSILLVAASAKTLSRVSPATFVPAAFVVSALLFVIEWGLAYLVPRIAAQVVYLQISGLGPMLGSGFWLITTERFDPRTAKRRFGQIAGAGTLGGLIGGLLAERVAAAWGLGAILPVLAALNLFCAWQIRRFGRTLDQHPGAHAIELSPDLSPDPAQSGLRALARIPYLRNLAALVLLGTVGAVLVDYIFKVQAVATFGRGEGLLRFFAVYYAAIGVLTFVVQTSSSRVALERMGLAMTTGTPSVALFFGALAGLLAPGLESAMAVRGGESVFRGSLFRSGYELFYTPIPPVEKRAAKSIIDVAFDRLGDALGGGAIRLMLLLPAAQQYPAILLVAVASSAAAIFVASRLNRGYIQTLERSLLNRAVELDLSEVQDTTTRTIMLKALTTVRDQRKLPVGATRFPERPAPSTHHAGTVLEGLDAEMLQILALRSRDRDRILRVLRNDDGVPAPIVPHIIPLLAWDPVANDAVYALRRVAEEHVGQLIDALIDPNTDFAIRRRLARVFFVCVSQRAADGLLLGLEDMRFEVRFQCARSLASILEKNPRIRIDRDRVFELVSREAAVGRPVWESQRLLHRNDDRDENFFVDEFVKDRASRSLAHVFTLLSLVLPKEPLQIAFRGLHTDDENLRGTALEYLEGVLPPGIRDRLWPYLEDRRPIERSARSREEILADLLRSHQSIVLNLEELRRRRPVPQTAGGEQNLAAGQLDRAASGKPWQTT
jgi:AAA family ATP:ADP antiporter